MSEVGRPRVLDEMKQREVCAIVATGAGMKTAAEYVGCSVLTIKRESQRNEGFAERLRQSELAAVYAPLQSLREQARHHWRAAAWLLERLYPERFGSGAERSTLPDELQELLQRPPSFERNGA